MVDNNEEIGKDSKIDSSSKIDEILEELNSHTRKFDEIAEKLQSMEKSISKIPKFDEKPKSEKKFVLRHVFENVASLNEGVWETSEREEHFNMRWYMGIKRNDCHLEFYVYFEPIASVGNKYAVETKLEYRMMGSNDENVIRTTKYCFEKVIGVGFDDFLSWKNTKDYLIDNNLTVEVEVEILKMRGFGKEILMKFDESVADLSDIVLIVNDRKFYLSKYFLSLHSSYFKTLFFGSFSESSQSEIPLSGIDPEDFHCFLEVLYGESVIDDSTVEGILHIADMYATPMVVRKCEEFLLEKSKKPAKKLLEMVARYNLENLKKKCMSEIKTVADIRAVLPPNIKDMDHLIMAELFEKSISFQ
ncbi:unnamed protein product [Caenorhabditis nigoni]